MEGIPAKEKTDFQFSNDIECGVIEINLNKKKWLIFGIYRPPSQSEHYFLEEIGKAIDLFSNECDNFLILGDFNNEESSNNICYFLDTYNLKNMIKEPTCFKSTENPRSIDLILTNRSACFKSTSTVETGLSDFHTMILTVIKGEFVKKGPKIVWYRDYSKYNKENFQVHLLRELSNLDVDHDYRTFQITVEKVLNVYAPTKRKYLRANDGPFMTKSLRKAIMRRSSLRNNFNKDRSSANWIAYKKQRNKCVQLLRQAKRDYYSNLNVRNLADNRTFWKTVKPLFSEKVQTSSKITLVDKGELITDDTNVAEAFNNYFINISDTLELSNEAANASFCSDVMTLVDPIDTIIGKFENHPSILQIKVSTDQRQQFDFQKTTKEEVHDQIKMLSQKASPQGRVPPKILKEISTVFAVSLSHFFNELIESASFPDELKEGEISALFKKGDPCDKKNYRPVTVLSSQSKIFERLMSKQIIKYIELSPYLCGFRKGYSTQHALMRLVEECRTHLDNKGAAGALLMDLSKAFDSLNHELLLAKLYAYGFSKKALQLIFSYLNNRKQRVKINGSFSSWDISRIGVPQGSVLGPLLFNIFINDLPYTISQTEVCNFADDTTIYTGDKNPEAVVSKLENDASILNKWYSDNLMKLNDKKCHLLMFGNKKHQHTITIGNSVINESNSQQLLGVNIDKNLNFSDHVNTLCKKASQKLHALARISPYMGQDKVKLIMNAFIKSHFSYCPLIWMFHDRKSNNRINKIHERALRIMYHDSDSSFEELLLKDKSVTFHQKNLQLLMIEVFKTVKTSNPTFMKEIFVERQSLYNLRSNGLSRPIPKSTSNGLETIKYTGSKLWELLPNEIKQLSSIREFKGYINTWVTDKCSCRICKTYIPNLGYL